MTSPSSREASGAPALPPFSNNAFALVCLLVGLAAYFLAWLASQIDGFPLPAYHDEYSYLLGADTFASGRLANPPHPMGFFFETYHQLQTPAYASKYPPAQALFMALGQLVGAPIYGVWFSHALLAAASVWMVRAFMPLRWAAAAGAYVALWFGFICYWTQSYWGGTVAALGGVLIWGAVKRLHIRITVPAACWLGVGAGLLVLSRPFEGFIACIVPGVLLVRRLLRSRYENRFSQDAFRLSALLIPVGLALGFQLTLNKAVTGDYARFPYSEYNRQYDANPILFWQSPEVPPSFNHERMENFDYKVAEEFTNFPTPAFPVIGGRVSNYIVFYTGGILILAALVYIMRPSRWASWMFWAVGVSLSSTILVHYYYPHYLAPALAPAVVLVVWALRNAALALYRCGGVKSSHAAAAAVAVGLLLTIRQGGMVPLTPVAEHAIHRQAVTKRLAEESGQHLVLVEYAPGVNPHIEYVFNGADIDKQNIVWARWHKDAGSRGLFDYYKGRKFWLLRVVRNGEPILREFNWVPGS